MKMEEIFKTMFIMLFSLSILVFMLLWLAPRVLTIERAFGG